MRKQHVAYWLLTICGFIVAMIVIGGITRLTLSGLSIVEWSPITGVLPPLTAEAWEALFEKYKLFPQFQKTFPALSLSEFKNIFFWEYFHRLVARSIGFIILIPGFLFWKKGLLSRELTKKILFGLVLGGFQGALGWFMVKSGLVDRPSVSHFRLAAHLLLALFILAYFLWLTLDCLAADLPHSKTKATSKELSLQKLFLFFIFPLLILQMTYGAFVAGLKAGFFYNTFPKMNGEWLPQNALYLNPLFKNWLENAVTVQWTHRWLGISLLLAIGFFWLCSRTRLSKIFLGLTLLQVGLGISTLLTQNNIVLASIHQLVGCFVFAYSIRIIHTMKGLELHP
jgi:cytochrome c oxidase assembly protein subunit 15